MYIAAVRIADDFGCHAIGIQYQQGLKDLLPASDLVEGTLNNADRPPVTQPRRPARALRRRAAAALQRGRRVRRPGRPDDLSRPQGDGPAGREHAARRALGRLGPLRHGEGLRVGVPDQRLGAAGPFHRRLERRHQRAAAGDVFPPRRRHAQGHLASRARSSGRGSSSTTAG